MQIHILRSDIFPLGEGISIRTPLSVNLYHINAGEPYAIFEEREKLIFTDFKKVRETIETFNDKISHCHKHIIDKPILLNIYSKKSNFN